jgi:hypothetical protein
VHLKKNAGAGAQKRVLSRLRSLEKREKKKRKKRKKKKTLMTIPSPLTLLCS